MHNKKHHLLYGAHMSIAGGLDQAILAGESIHCTAIQIFTKSNRQWQAQQLHTTEIDKFISTATASSIKTIVGHTSYLINIGSPTTTVEKKSVTSLQHELARCELLHIPYLVLHPGSRLHDSIENCLNRIVRNLNTVLEKASGTTMLLLETMAGQGSTVCSLFEELAYVCNRLDRRELIGICFDTCHAFAAGHSFDNRQNYEAMLDHISKTIGIEKIKAIHMNDSKTPFNKNIDRHETIGKGCMGLEPFKFIMNDPLFFDVPKILETPKESLFDDVYNMNILKNLISSETKKNLYIE